MVDQSDPIDRLHALHQGGWLGLQVPPLTSVSAVRDFLACGRAYFWKAVAGLEPKHRPAALSAGLLVHEVAADLRRGQDPTGRLAAERERMLAAALSEDALDKAEAGLAMAHAVARNLPAWEARQQPALVTLQVEQTFAAHGPSQLTGRIDLVARVEDGPWAGLWVEDIKTHEKGRGDEVIDRLPFDKQFRVYALEKAARGVVITLIAKTAKRRTKKESLDDYLARIAQEYAEEPMFRRHFEPLPDAADVIPELAAARGLHAQAAVNYGVHGHGVAAWPQNEAHCFARGRCPFLELCRGEGVGLYRERRQHD